VTYESYFNDQDGSVDYLLTGGAFPNSLAAFETDLG
jgi:hypothetical protein